MNRATAETSVEQANAEGLAPLLCYLADTVNLVVQRYFGYRDLEFVWQQDRSLDPLAQAQVDEIYLRSGVFTVEEVRSQLGKPPKPLAADHRG
jgi:hypothetical protein